jgi:hypothetical protein
MAILGSRPHSNPIATSVFGISALATGLVLLTSMDYGLIVAVFPLAASLMAFWYLTAWWWSHRRAGASVVPSAVHKVASPLRTRCTRRGVFSGICGVLGLSVVDGAAGGALAGCLSGLLIGSLLSPRIAAWLAVAGCLAGGVLGYGDRWETVLTYVVGGGSVLGIILFGIVTVTGLVLGFALAVWWLFQAFGVIDMDSQRQRDVLSRMGALLPREEAALWLRSNIGYLADISDPRERRRFLRSLTAHLPTLLWTSWTIHLRHRIRCRHFDMSRMDGENRDVMRAVLTLSRRDFRAFLRGLPTTVRITTGRLMTIRYRAVGMVTRADDA